MAFVDLGKKVMDRFVADLGTYGQIEKAPSMEGKVMSVVVIPRTPHAADKKTPAVEKGTEHAET